MKTTAVLIGTWVAGGLTLAGLETVAWAQDRPNVYEKFRETGKESKQTVDEGFSLERREEYQRKVDQSVNKLQTQMKEVQEQMATAPPEQRANLQERFKTMSADLDTLQRESASLANAKTREAWEAAKNRVQGLVDRVTGSE